MWVKHDGFWFPSMAVSSQRQISRRGFEAGVAAMAGTAVLATTRPARANWLWVEWLAGTVAAAVIGWGVEKLLDYMWDDYHNDHDEVLRYAKKSGESPVFGTTPTGRRDDWSARFHTEGTVGIVLVGERTADRPVGTDIVSALDDILGRHSSVRDGVPSLIESHGLPASPPLKSYDEARKIKLSIQRFSNGRSVATSSFNRNPNRSQRIASLEGEDAGMLREYMNGARRSSRLPPHLWAFAEDHEKWDRVCRHQNLCYDPSQG